MSKPSWDEAPPWASYVAMDGDGSWYWYEERPEWRQRRNEWGTDGKAQRIDSPDPEDSLEPRP